MPTLIRSLILYLISFPALAQNWDCSVLLVESGTDRILDSYYGIKNGRADFCRNELRECKKDQKRKFSDREAECVKLDSYYTSINMIYSRGNRVVVVETSTPVIPVEAPMFDAKLLLLDMRATITSDSDAFEVLAHALRKLDSAQVQSLMHTCEDVYLNSEKTKCLTRGIERMNVVVPRTVVEEFILHPTLGLNS